MKKLSRINLKLNQNNMNGSNQEQSADENTNGHLQLLMFRLQEHQEKQLEDFESRIETSLNSMVK